MARNMAHDDDSAGTESEDALQSAGTGAQETDEQAGKAQINRRNYLRLGAATAAAVAGAGAATSTTAASDYGMNFSRTVDAVSDLGWDPNGNDPVTDSLQDNMEDGTLIELPPGEYLVDGRIDASDITNWGIRGTGSDKGDARFVVPQGSSQRIFNIRDDSRNVLIENLTFDQYDTFETCIGNVLQVADNLMVKDVEYAGKNPSEQTGATSHLNVYVFDPDGVAVLDGLVVRGESELIDYPDNPLTVFCGAESVGTLYVRNCEFENCGEHAIYASRCQGNVRIENSFFKNNQNTQARISGEGSYVKDSTFVWDVDSHNNKGEFQATTGMTFEAGFRGYAGGLVENCEFICKSSAPNSGCLKVDGSHGGLTVRNCTFEIDADGAEPIWADAPGDSHMIDGQPDKPWDITIENVHIHGTSESVRGNTGAIEIQGRDGSVVKNACIDMEGNRDGVVFADMTGTVADTNINVPGEAIVLEGADANTSNVTNTACDGSDTGSGDGSSGGDSGSGDGGSDGGSGGDSGSGDGSDDGTVTVPEYPTYGNTLRILGEAGADAFTYSVTIDGQAALVTEGEYSATDASQNNGVGEKIVDNGDGTVTATGIVAGGGGDTFTYDGKIVGFEAGGPAKVIRNGEEVDPGLFTPADTFRVFSKAGADAFTYEFTVTETAELVTEGENAATPANEDGVGETVTENDDGTVTVSGIVANGGGDSFRIRGTVTEFRTAGNPVVYRNDERFDWQEIGLPRTLTIDGSGSLASYDFAVSGELAANDAAGGINGEDSISGGSAEGTVSDGVDAYLFSGSITSFNMTGTATVMVDGEQVNPDDLGLDHELSVVGLGQPANYGLTVDGELAASPDGLAEGDVIDGVTATGSVSTEADKYLFSGEITAFELQGVAAVYLNGQQVDPALLTSNTDPVLANKLVVLGSGTESSYTFAVSGNAEKAPDLGDVEAEDTIEAAEAGEVVTGSVADDDDGYRFSGDLSKLRIDGSAAITFADLDG